MDQPTNQTIKEGDLAAALGLSREALKKMRRDLLERDKDWALGEESRAIEYTILALKKIRAALGLPEPLYLTYPGSPTPESVILALKKKGTVPEELQVIKAYGNGIVVLCVQTAAPNAQVRLKVRDNRNFTPGMIVPGCVHVEADRYDYVGRLPRRKGRI